MKQKEVPTGIESSTKDLVETEGEPADDHGVDNKPKAGKSIKLKSKSVP